MSRLIKHSLVLSTMCMGLVSVAVSAAEPATQQKVSFSPSATALTSPTLLGNTVNSARDQAYVFSAPPRESAQTGTEVYGPIAEYLSAAIGKKVVYRQPANWIAYQEEMRRGDYDLIFDGPHFNSWRVAKLQHTILVKAPGEHSFVVVVMNNNQKIHELKQLNGRGICGMSPPSLGTLTVLNEFSNPLRQPLIVSTDSWDNIYNGLKSGRCTAAILPVPSLAKYDPQGSTTRVIFRARTYPNQAFSASPRILPEDQGKIAKALSAPAARLATSKLRDAFALQGDFQPTGQGEYAGIASILKDTWGYR